MSEKNPTLDQWRQLYDLAAQIKKIAPWEWMTEIDLFGVQDPETDSTGFVCVMGMRGEHFAVAFYPDARSLHDFRDLHYNQPADSVDRLMEIPQLQLSFESRDFVEEQDRQTLGQLGLRFRGANAWPLFRSYRAGFFPWFIDTDEARFLCQALEQTLDVAPRFREERSLLYPGQQDVYLIRVKTADGWTDQHSHVPPPEPEERIVRLDTFTLNRFGKLPQAPRTLALDLFRLWSPVKEGADRPFYPYLLLLVDPTSREVAGFDMLRPLPSLEGMWDTVPQSLLQVFERLGGLPSRIQVSSPQLLATLRSTAEALDFGLEHVDSLPILDQLKTQLSEAVKAGFDPSLLPVDFGEDLESNDEEEEGEFDDDASAGEFAEFLEMDSFDPLDVLGRALRALPERMLLRTRQIDYLTILDGQTIDANGSGTVLRDFARLLAAIPPEGIEITPAGRVPKVRFMTQLNQQLARPFAHGLKRPQPKSYPNVSGLYLLLRAAGLGRIQGDRLLVPDEHMLAAWHRLNPTEQYFTLLESWLRRGSPEILGEHVGLFYNTIDEWGKFHLVIPEDGLQIAGDYDRYHYINYSPGLPNLALMEIFGLLTLQHGSPEPGVGWRVERAERTPFGDALLARLFDYLATEQDKEDAVAAQQPFGRLQPAFEPLFPDWKANLSLPEARFVDGQHVFKVSLGRIWRRIAVPAALTLDDLAGAILDAYAFDYDHLYRFSWENRFGLTVHVHHPAMDESPFTDEVRVGDLPFASGDAMSYLYDFGDNWEFTVLLERVDPADRRRKRPVLLESRGKAPEQYPDWGDWDG